MVCKLLQRSAMDSIWTQNPTGLQLVLRLVVAILLGGLVGWDREHADKPAGLRTHMLVALGAASFTLLGFEATASLAAQTREHADPSRVLQGVIGGIGFLGAGAIIRTHGHISGITTAASVWVAGALGSAAGLGAYVLAGSTTLLTLTVLNLLGRLERKQSESRTLKGSEPPCEQSSPSHRQP